MEKAGLERMEKKEEELQGETEPEIINKQGAIIDYGGDSSDYDSEDYKANAYKYDDDPDFCCGIYEDFSDDEEIEYDWIANGRPHSILTWGEHTDSDVVLPALCTPQICVIFSDGTRKYIPIDSDEPLPAELYKDRIIHGFFGQPKDVYEMTTKDGFKVQIDSLVEKPNLDLERQIAGLALSYFKNTQDGDYEYVRGVKTRAAFSQRFGIHMIFIAHPRGDDSAGKLFSVHVATGDPPLVLDCHIFCNIDPQCIHEGSPRLQGKKVRLSRTQIACNYCAEEFN